MHLAGTPHWKAGVRRTIEQHASACEAFTGLPHDDVFYPPQGKGAGVWALRSTVDMQAAAADTVNATDTVALVEDVQVSARSTVLPVPVSADTPASPPRIFVSHSHNGNRFTARLVGDLRAAGADVWVDMTEIAYDDFLKRINEGLANRDWMILVMTPDALKSPWVQLEVNAALGRVVKRKMRGVIPVIAKPCDDDEIPPLWAALHYYDATRDYSGVLSRLLKVLELAN
jgi:hypothetical protein